VLDANASAAQILYSLESGMKELSLAPAFVQGAIINQSGVDLGELTLIGSGNSNFAGSPAGRVFNVRKALREHINNVVVLPGEEFSFNGILGGPVSERRGWKLAKVISAGELVMEPGGGICQTSTTLYRGILQAGLPVGKRKSHSMYISYYEKDGVGLDATIYYGQQDLTFTNNTAHPVVIQSFDEGDDAFVYLYGTPDGRTSTIEGPFFSGTEPQDFIESGRKIKSNEIGWLQRVEHANGIIEMHPILSAYKSLPRSIVDKYTALTSR
jgi:vancomycin resistance protein YoaR